MKSWVCGHLTGGLGNRLFQHAAAAGLAEKWNYPLVFNIPECEPTNHGPFETILKLFPGIPVLTEQYPVRRLPEPHGAVFTYIPFPERPTDSFVSIDGWRQTELYFPKEGIVPDFDSAIPFQRQISLLKQFHLEGEEQDTTWFLHVRLGDYKILPHHQIDMNSYYSKAIQHIPKGARVLLFSDEVKEFGPYLLQYFEALGLSVILADVPDELETLFLMSECKGGAIVANSTFSWWGAYFAHRKHPRQFEHKVVYPKCWGKGLPIAKDIVPLWGIQIDNE